MKRTDARRNIDRAAKGKYLLNPFNRYKHAVRMVVFRAVECGIIVRPVICEQCDNTSGLEAHHEDYHKPLSVEWLCGVCHSARHLKTHCKRGHAFTPENTYEAVENHRVCRICAAMRARTYRASRLSKDALIAAETQLAAAREILTGK